MWNIAIKTLIADRGKLLAALVGVIFAIVLVNVQGGLFIGLITKASLLVDQSDADIWVGHKQMHNVDFAHDIPEFWIERIRSARGVKRAEPYIVGHSIMTLPDGGFEPVLVIGCEPSSLLGNASVITQGDPADLRQTDGIIIDTEDAEKLGSSAIGDIREIGGVRGKIVAKSKGLLGFLVTPYVFTTMDRARNYLRMPHDRCSYFLVQVQDESSVDSVCDAIKQLIPDVEAYSKSEYAWRSIEFWLKRTGLGISFGASTALGLLVGLIIVGQTLYASVLDRLTEFATLKALGATDSQVCSLVMIQAMTVAVSGSLVGQIAVSWITFSFSSPRATILIPTWLSIGSSLLVTAMCLAAAILPYWRIRQIDPAMVLQS